MAGNLVKAVYSGTFDPFTLGHRNVLERAAGLFGHVTVAVAESTKKQTLFTLEERVEIAESEAAGLPNVDVRPFSGLLRDFCLTGGYRVIVRGIRSGTDFNYESQMAGANKMLMPGVETVFLMTEPPFEFVTSSAVREIGWLKGPLDGFVSPAVAAAVAAKYQKAKRP